MTVVLAKGIYAVGESMVLKPKNRSFSAANRLTLPSASVTLSSCFTVPPVVGDADDTGC